ncbi:MAG: hypothetical protein MJ153_08565, partial [Clostridia bacterium]|nr:hypothetical protein [Clostridia bacterium]
MLTAKVLLRESVKQLDKPFSYGVPDALRSRIKCGQYVNVPFGRGNHFKLAVVIDITDITDEKEISKLKFIQNIVDDDPVLSSEQIKLIDFLKSHYLCTSGDAISLLVPSLVGNRNCRQLRYLSLADKNK